MTKNAQSALVQFQDHGGGNWRVGSPPAANDPVFPLVEYSALQREITKANYPSNPYEYTGSPSAVFGQNSSGIVYFGDQFIADWRYRILPQPDYVPPEATEAGPWRIYNGGGLTPTVDGKHNLIGLPNAGGTYAETTLATAVPGWYGGDYVLEWDSAVCPTMRLSLGSANGITLTLSSDDAANGRRVYTLTVPTGLTEDDLRSAFMTVFMDAPVTGYNDWHLYMPGHEAACKAGEPFNIHHIEQIAEWQVWRGMDVLNANGNVAVTSADIPDETFGTWSELSLPPELFLRACVKAGLDDICINLPHQFAYADFLAYALRLYAEYLATPVDQRPSRIKIEYSNEVWNFTFPQTTYALNQAALDPEISQEPDTNFRMDMWVAKKSVEMKAAFVAAFGADSDVIELVVAGFASWWARATNRVASPYEPTIADDLDWFLIAPYIGTSLDQAFADSNSVQSWTDQQYLNYFRGDAPEAVAGHANIPEATQWCIDNKVEVERATGRTDIKFGTYEGGQHLDSYVWTDSANLTAQRARFRQFNESTAMGDLYFELNQAIMDQGYEMLIGFGYLGGHSDIFYWGTQDNEWGLPYAKKLADNAINLPRAQPSTALTTIRAYMAAHSLWEHGSFDYLTGEWLYNFSQHDGRTSLITGRFGQLSTQAASLPNLTWRESYTQFGYPYGEGTAAVVWNSGTFDTVDWDYISLCPWNFAQEGTAYDATPDPLTHALTLLDFYETNSPDATKFVFEHWPETSMVPGVPGSANLTAQQWQTFWEYTRGSYHTWFVNFQDQLNSDRPSIGVRMIPVGPVLADLFLDEPYMSGVSSTDYFEDDAPHGLPALYFLSALVFYRFFFGVSVPTDYTIPITTPANIPNAIRSNFSTIIAFIDARLTHYNSNGVRVYA